MPRKPRVLILPSDDDAPGFYRLGEPYEELAQRMLEIDFHTQYAVGLIDLQDMFRAILWCDILITQRAMNEVHTGLLRFAKAYGKKVILEFDDALLHIPKDSPVYEGWGNETPAYLWLREAISLADYLHVSTPELATAYRPHTKAPISVFLNGLPIGHPKYEEGQRRRHQVAADRTVVMWHGTPCHQRNFEFLNEITVGLCAARPEVSFAICSTKEDWFKEIKVPDEQLIVIKGHEVRKYANVPSFADIHLTPLVDDDVFNAGKSELKVLQAAVWKLPAISSPLAPYRRFHEKTGGANVLVESNKPEDWVREILRLVDDRAARRNLGERAHAGLVEHYSLSSINDDREAFYREVFAIQLQEVAA